VPTLTTLVNFDSSGNGAWLPRAGLLTDASGNLFGVTGGGGPNNSGTILEIANTGTFANPVYASAATTLAVFDGTNGSNLLFGSLIVDGDGNLFGAAANGGANGIGTVYELAKTPTGYASTPTVLTSFSGPDGSFPYGGLVADAAGNLIGTTNQGGTFLSGSSGNLGHGVVYEIAKTPTGYASTPTVLLDFDGPGGYGAYPDDTLIADSAGDLFGTASDSGIGTGTIFEIPKTPSGYGTATVLVAFNGADGFNPANGLVADTNGNLFGSTLNGGANGHGVVYELAKTPSG